jgi:uncharacterized protein (DUF433 family)
MVRGKLPGLAAGRLTIGRRLAAWPTKLGEMVASWLPSIRSVLLKPGIESVTAVFTTQIELDGRGVAWIGGTKVKVTEVVLDKIAYGWSPEEIHFQHPHLSLAQIHGALTYYYENQERLDAQIRHDMEEADTLAVQASDPDFRRKLIDLKRSL